MKRAFPDYLAELGAGAQGPQTAACFDLDRTLISDYSVKAFFLEGVRSRTLSPWGLVLQFVALCRFRMGRLDYDRAMSVTIRDLADLPAEDLMALGERAFRRRVASLIYVEARALVAQHQRLGHRLALVTSATRAQAAPVAASLSIGDMCCTELQVSDGILTGEFTPCHGEAKRRSVLGWLAEQGIDPSSTYFYSDSDEDLPLLEAVGKPVAVNAKSSLAAVAAERRWPELEFSETGAPTDGALNSESA